MVPRLFSGTRLRPAGFVAKSFAGAGRGASTFAEKGGGACLSAAARRSFPQSVVSRGTLLARNIDHALGREGDIAPESKKQVFVASSF